MERWSKPNWVGTRNYSENLLCHYLFSDGSAQYVFLDLVDEGSAVVNRSLSFCTTRNLHVCASANGLLLLSSVQDNQVWLLMDFAIKLYEYSALTLKKNVPQSRRQPQFLQLEVMVF
ncbi:uncharacterized protein LOC116146927 [Pistacia vera]|uniref:uncharacterized protein LOC116146927 n=1 Tax=Pistacia vera TaxID=55513 RepID=UPI001263CFAB|nr:uncharacterized protein LOC116146927 [Pistacia vera]